MISNSTAISDNRVSSEIVVPVLKRLASKTAVYLTLSIISTVAVGVFVVVVPMVDARVPIYALAVGVALASVALLQVRKLLQIGRFLRLAKAGAQISMDGSELTASHNYFTEKMLVDVKTSYAINFPPTGLKLPRAVVIE